MTCLDKLGHIAEEEGEQQCSDMASVDVGIGHNYYLVITKLTDIKVLTDSGTESNNNGCQLIVTVNLVISCLFNVEHFTPKWENCLIGRVSALNCRTACTISLDDEYFCLGRVVRNTVGKLFGHSRFPANTRLITGSVSCLLGGLSRIRSGNSLVDNYFSIGRMLL